MSNFVNYTCTGRYMDGQELICYRLTNNKGESIRVNREKAILLISRGLVNNMRVQYSGDDVIIRGKGVNLNELPVYNMSTNKTRNVGNATNSGSNDNNGKLKQYRIIKRIMSKTSCIGYVITDEKGNEKKINREGTIKLCINGLIENAEVKKYTPSGSTESKIIIRGIGIDLKALPVILVDKGGTVVDTSKKEHGVPVRATRLSKAGILYNEEKKSKKLFKAGDFIICAKEGNVYVLENDRAQGKLKKSGIDVAICDEFLNGNGHYSIEFLGSKKVNLGNDKIKNWEIVNLVI